jgi:hypothetical protein
VFESNILDNDVCINYLNVYLFDENMKKNFRIGKNLLILGLDPDPELDPDPHITNADPKHWFQIREIMEQIRISLVPILN